MTESTPTLTGGKCECAACGRFFTGITAFDAHRAWTGDKRTCRNPAYSGLILRKNGCWGYPPMTEQQKRERGWA